MTDPGLASHYGFLRRLADAAEEKGLLVLELDADRVVLVPARRMGPGAAVVRISVESLDPVRDIERFPSFLA